MNTILLILFASFYSMGAMALTSMLGWIGWGTWTTAYIGICYAFNQSREHAIYDRSISAEHQQEAIREYVKVVKSRREKH